MKTINWRLFWIVIIVTLLIIVVTKVDFTHKDTAASTHHNGYPF